MGNVGYVLLAFTAVFSVCLQTYVTADNETTAEQEKFIAGKSPMARWLIGETLPLDTASSAPPENEVSIEAGKVLYGYRCAVCHGIKGDGKGKRAGELDVMPRDFTFGTYKFRSTPSGFPPTNLDLFKSISRGIHGTGMLPWIGFTTSQKWLVTYYIKTFSDIFEEEKPVAINVAAPQKPAREYIEQGKTVYEKAKCFDCHGSEGRGDGEKADKLKDDWRRPIRPRNFQEEVLKRGLLIEEIYLTIATGLDGTPMEPYSEKLTEEEIMALAYYIRSLAPKLRKSRTLGLTRKEITRDENLAVRDIDHHMGVRFRMPWERNF